MFTTIKATQFDDDSVLIQAVCLAADSKPTTGIANGSTCIEIDTGKIFMFDESGDAWTELQ